MHGKCSKLLPNARRSDSHLSHIQNRIPDWYHHMRCWIGMNIMNIRPQITVYNPTRTTPK
jgi:hypothetical protein